MNYSILFCLLIALVNSKFESFTSEDYLEFCPQNSTEKVCKASSFPPFIDTALQCCYYSVEVEKVIKTSICQIFPTEVNEIKNIVESPTMLPLLRELYGFSYYNKDSSEEMDIPNATVNVSCKNGDISYSTEKFEYTDNEIKTLKSENHCLRKFINKAEDFEYDVGECSEGELLEETKSSDIECGTILFKVTLSNNLQISYKTCFLFNFELYSNVAKLTKNQLIKTFVISYIDQLIKERAKEQGFTISQYTAEFYDSKGNKIKYDSETKTFTINGKSIDDDDGSDDSKDETDNKGSISSFSKYLFFLILVLF